MSWKILTVWIVGATSAGIFVYHRLDSRSAAPALSVTKTVDISSSPSLKKPPTAMTGSSAANIPAGASTVSQKHEKQTSAQSETTNSEQSRAIEENSIRATQDDDAWAEARSDYLKKIVRLPDDAVQRLEGLRVELKKQQDQLLQKTTESEEEEFALMDQLDSLRKNYEQQLKNIMGDNEWQNYLAFYKKHWGLQESSSTQGIHYALK